MKGFNCIHLGNYLRHDAERVFSCHEVGETTLSKCDSCPLFKKHAGYAVFELAGVMQTTAPHKREYFQKSYHSLLQQCHNCMIETDEYFKGAFPAFVRAITKIFYGQPHASAYLYLQDDTVLHPRTFEKLHSELPEGYMVASLYNPPSLPEFSELWKQFDNGWNSPGACCYVFSPEGICSLLVDPYLQWHRRFGATGGTRCIDSVVGVWAAQHGGIWYRREPLAEHIGEVSSIDKGES